MWRDITAENLMPKQFLGVVFKQWMFAKFIVRSGTCTQGSHSIGVLKFQNFHDLLQSNHS